MTFPTSKSHLELPGETVFEIGEMENAGDCRAGTGLWRPGLA